MTIEGTPLQQFAPKPSGDIRIEYEQDLQPVVDRIAKVLPKDLIWNLYASSPSETGGHVTFPYCRIDTAVIIARDYVWMINNLKVGGQKLIEYYENAQKQAFRALVWVEIGFQGLENLARSPASSNWTSAVGHTVTREQRARGIMTSGKEMYDECLTSFAAFRKERGFTGDIFTEYKLDYLLDRFKT